MGSCREGTWSAAGAKLNRIGREQEEERRLPMGAECGESLGDFMGGVRAWASRLGCGAGGRMGDVL